MFATSQAVSGPADLSLKQFHPFERLGPADLARAPGPSDVKRQPAHQRWSLWIERERELPTTRGLVIVGAEFSEKRRLGGERPSENSGECELLGFGLSEETVGDLGPLGWPFPPTTSRGR